MAYVTWPRPFRGHFVIRRLGLAMFNPHIKSEMSKITCNEEIKGNAKCKNFRFEPPFGDLGVTYTVHLWLVEKRVINFLLVLIELFFRQLSWLRRYEQILVEIVLFERGWVVRRSFVIAGRGPAYSGPQR